MGNLLYEAKRHLAELDSNIEQIEQFLATAPEGRLACEKHRDIIRYYWVNNEEKGVYAKANPKAIKERKQNISKDMEFAKLLASKKYYSEILPEMKKDRRITQELIHLQEHNPTKLNLLKMNQHRQNLIDSKYCFDAQSVQTWKDLKYTRKPIDINDNTVQTNNGEIVRSKSEKIIADMLLDYGIPYRYECPLLLNGGNTCIYPDFVTLNVRIGKEYFWEHLGMLDSPGYFSNTTWKLDLYSRNNIFVGEKLLLTYETNNRMLNVNMVRHNIEKYLL